MAKSQKRRDVPEGATVVATNRVAHRDYEILDTLEVGMVLRGSEVKSLRESKVQLGESFAIFYQNELWLVGLRVAAYSHSGSSFAHDPDRRRKLLAHREQMQRWSSRADRDHLTIIPLALYFVGGRAKIKLALGRGKSKVDRRQDIAKRDSLRETQRAVARSRRRE